MTLLLNFITLPIVYSISLISGIQAAKHRGQTFDLASGTTFLGLWSVPTIWAGVMVIGLFANRAHLHWFPASGLHDTFADTMRFFPAFTPRGFERGWLLDTAWHLVLPVDLPHLRQLRFSFQADPSGVARQPWLGLCPHRPRQGRR